MLIKKLILNDSFEIRSDLVAPLRFGSVWSSGNDLAGCLDLAFEVLDSAFQTLVYTDPWLPTNLPLGSADVGLSLSRIISHLWQELYLRLRFTHVSDFGRKIRNTVGAVE